MQVIKYVISWFLASTLCLPVFAQQAKELLQKIEHYQQLFPKEKLYLSFDKSSYFASDTIWFKTILLDGHLNASANSEKIYIELFNDSAKLVDSKVIALNHGLGYGDFSLARSIRDGVYTIRAYSNWQKNFGSDYFFQKSLYVGNATDKTWLIDFYLKEINEDKKQGIDFKVRLSDIKNQSVGLKQVEVSLWNDKKRVMQADFQTSPSGTIEGQISLNENQLSPQYRLQIVDKNDRNKRASLPVTFQEAENVDLQFLPEGGYLVNSIPGKVAFKVLGADGRGKELSGQIINNHNEIMANIATLAKGMGSFMLSPKKDERYYAVFTTQGKERKIPLPTAKEEGVSLRIDHLSKADTLLVYMRATESFRSDKDYQLLAQKEDGLIFMVAVNLNRGFTTLKLAKREFPDGLIRFTLFSPSNQPLNERIALINQKQKLLINVTPSQHVYKTRDSIALAIRATDEKGMPVQGSFAIAVVDNSQLKEKAATENILSHFLLQSSLRGNIEDAATYFADNQPQTLAALDNMLLCQGWTGHSWSKITAPGEPEFKPEKLGEVKGRLNLLLNRPAANIKLTLLSLGKQLFVTDTVSNKDGGFVFKDLPLTDSISYAIKIKNARGKTSSAVITVDEFIPAIPISSSPVIEPWYVQTDATANTYFQMGLNRVKQAEVDEQKRTGIQLKEVEIKGVREEVLVNLGWDANPLENFTEEQLKQIPRKSLFDLIKDRIPEFRIDRFYADDCGSRPYLHSKDALVIGTRLVAKIRIDKIDTELHSDIQLLNYFNAEDVKHISVYKGCAFIYIDITSRSGNGPWMGRANGTYVYRPKPVYPPKEFYRPKYAIEKGTSIPDYRSTVFWDANVINDEQGKARVSFYAADIPGSYTIKIEGTNMNGRFGYSKGKIAIEK